MPDRVRVKPAAEFDDPGREIVAVDGQEVGVIKLDGEYYAVENVCQHEGGPVAKGEVRPKLEAEDSPAGEHVTEDFSGDPCIACPWHGFTYDLATGEHVGDPGYALRTFEVTVDDGDVYVSV